MRHLQGLAPPRRETVRAALRTTFGRSTLDLQPLIGGVSGALIFRLEVRDRSYVLRIEPDRIAQSDVERGFGCMAAAAAAGVAPPVRFADAAAGVAIMDFVSGRPLSTHPQGQVGLVRDLGALIARLQHTPTFPRLGDYPEAVGIRLSNLEKSGVVPLDLQPHLDAYARIKAALPWDEAHLVSSHNDPNPRNMLFDGERLWLIDWELAFRNDPLVDVAIATMDLAETPELETALLQATFGAAPDRPLRARLSLVRLLARLFYGCIVLEGLGDQAAAMGHTVEPGLTPQKFREAVADGRLASGSAGAACAFARMSLDAFAAGVATPAFEQALMIVGQG